jgi:hypothetical protein
MHVFKDLLLGNWIDRHYNEKNSVIFQCVMARLQGLLFCSISLLLELQGPRFPPLFPFHNEIVKNLSGRNLLDGQLTET